MLCVHAQITGVHKHSEPNVDYLTVQMDKYCAQCDLSSVCSPLPELLYAWLLVGTGVWLAPFMAGSVLGGLEGPGGPWYSLWPQGSCQKERDEERRWKWLWGAHMQTSGPNPSQSCHLWKMYDVASHIRRWKSFLLLPSRIGLMPLFLLFIAYQPMLSAAGIYRINIYFRAYLNKISASSSFHQK